MRKKENKMKDNDVAAVLDEFRNALGKVKAFLSG